MKKKLRIHEIYYEKKQYCLFLSMVPTQQNSLRAAPQWAEDSELEKMYNKVS